MAYSLCPGQYQTNIMKKIVTAPTTDTQYDLDNFGIYEGSNRTLQVDLVYLINAN